MKGPLAKVFRTPKQAYVYDTVSNGLFRTDRVTAALVGLLCDGLGIEAAGARLGRRYSAAQIAQSIQVVSGWIEKGYLSSQRPAGLRLEADRDEVRRDLSSNLRQIILGVTQACNLRCRYCVYSGDYQNFRAHDKTKMTQAVARKALDFFLEHSKGQPRTSVSFYGGEPLLNFQLIRDCVEYYTAKAVGRVFFFNLTTNGTLLTRDARDFFAKHDVILRISLDGPAGVHNTNRVYRNGRGSFESIRQNLAALKQDHEAYFLRRVSVAAVAAAPYQLTPVREFFENDPLFEGISVSVNGVRPIDTDYLNKFPVAYDRREIAALRKSYVRQTVARRAVSPVLKALYEPGLTQIALRPRAPLPDYPHPNQICMPGARRLFVDTGGRFQPCERFNDTIFIGDVDHGFDEDKLFGLVDEYIALSEQECRDCWAVRLCRTCFISANGDGLDARHKHEHCALERRSLEGSLSLYCRLMEQDPDCLDHLHDIVFS